MNVKRFACFLAGTFLTTLLCCPVLLAKAPFANYKAHYTVHWHGLTVGHSYHLFHKQKNGHYLFELNSSTSVPFLHYTLYEKSAGFFRNGRFKPNYYALDYNKKPKNKAELRFNWQAHRIKSLLGKKTWPLKTQTLDRLSHQLQLRYDLLRHKKLPKVLNYRVFEGHRYRNYQFHYIGDAVVTTALGPQETVVYQRKIKSRQTKVWYAKKLHYLPVKVVHNRKGNIEGVALIASLK